MWSKNGHTHQAISSLPRRRFLGELVFHPSPQRRQSYQTSTSHKHKQMTKNATVEKKTSARWTENVSHKMSFTKPLPSHRHNTNIMHQTHTCGLPQILKNDTGIIQHPFDTKARGTKLNYLNTFGHSMTTTNLSPSSGESLSSANLITVLATNVTYAYLRNM